MFKQAILLSKPVRFLWILLVLLVLAVVAFSPLILGLAMMHLEESRTGIPQNEGNSTWGVLPWLSIGTLAVCLPIAGLIVVAVAAMVLHDIIACLRYPQN